MEKIFSSKLQKKYVHALTLLLIPFVLFTLFITANLWKRIEVQSKILSRNFNIIAATEQAMLAVRDGNNYLLRSILIQDPHQFYQLRQDSEKSWLTSEKFVETFTLDTEDKTFRSMGHGEEYGDWYKQYWEEQLQTQSIPTELKRISGTASEYLSDFSVHARRAMQQLDRSYALSSKSQLKEAQEARKLAWKEVLEAGRFQELANEQLKKLVSIARNITHSSQEHLYRMQYENVLLIVLNAVVLLVLMNIFSWYYIKRLMVTPISRLAKHVSQLGKGNLNVSIPVETDDEIGQLGDQFNRMRCDLRRVMVSKEHVDNIVASIPDSLIILDSNAMIRSVNKATLMLLGYKEEETLHKPFGMIFSSDWGKELAIVNLENTLGERRGSYIEREYIRKNGKKLPVLFSYSAIPDQDKSQVVYLCVAQDLTEHKHIEAEKHAAQHQLQEAQKMESIGQLAGGVAHDFNNLLGGILGYSQLVIKRASLSEEDSDFMKKIITLSKRASELTSQLLAFARKSQHERIPLNLNEIVKEATDILSRTLDKTMEVKALLDDELKWILGDNSQILQILMNLGLNARDAMPNGGTLTFRTENFSVNKAFSKQHPELTPGNYIRLVVSDTGTGIPEKHLSKVFEPFFTTKPVGKGTGLGLSMVYGIMQQHNGIILVDSKMGKGTTFSLYFTTLTEEAVLKSEEKLVRVKEPDEIDKTILVVDDEGYMRDLVAKALQGKKTRLLFASDGEEAIDVYNSSKEKIDCIIMDMVMPKLDGVSAYKALVAKNKDLKVLFFSGYSENAQIKEMLKSGNVAFMQKPFEREILIQKIISLYQAKK